MKLIGKMLGLPVYSSPDCPPDTMYMVNKDHFNFDIKRKKNGEPDMRYAINRLYFKTLGHNHRDPIFTPPHQDSSHI